MFSKKSVPIILVLLGVASVLYALKVKSFDNPASKYERILQTVGAFLEEGHYSPQRVDDAFSEKVFDKFITTLDGDKGYFLKKDVDSLKGLYGDRIDDEMHGAPLKSFYGISTVYSRDLDHASQLFKQILAQPFDFSVKEDVDMNYDKMSFASSDADLYDRWRKRLKYLVLERYVDLTEARDKEKEARDKGKSKDTTTLKTDVQLEAQARLAIYKIMDRNFTRLKTQETEDAQFDGMVNCITNTMDPHTDFFPPVERRSFNELMSGHFYGIGASLEEDDAGNIKIATLVAGSPAWKSGQIAAGDIILKVAQGNDSAQDLTGYAREDAVKIIRGSKGSVVKLTIKKADGSTKVVALIRDEILVEDTFARSATINDNGRKLGYIYLPVFYADFDHRDGARCSVDVAKEVEKLKEEKVDGIIIDLRGNGGGSLMDVVNMVGLFVKSGPVVQVRGRGDAQPSVMRDNDQGVLYSGPLAVLVNSNSASASEIFAAAIQDYHRGLIIGSDTYGKGTVQREIELDPRITGNWPKDSVADLGSIKLTLQKFYRISGGSTQLKGVTPDVAIPDQMEYLKDRERDNPDALKWDEISKAEYEPWRPGYDPVLIRKESEERVDRNPSFQTISKDARWLADQDDKRYPLEMTAYKDEKTQMQKIYQELEKVQKLPSPLDMTLMPMPSSIGGAQDTTSGKGAILAGRNQMFLNSFKNDLELGESVHIVGDMIKQGNLASGKVNFNNQQQ
ncbi:carboxyl-terminal processing protease [Dinghuibacter silviterrae]|uniref:Carboxyl-terminal processing protease n=2 Tax=Dinghuibacter silviterrae TaxID=1539049 RepID=A0A4R8DJI6_9BACT|nr:carboxyl-terminal processing protease [Dinghuibacter silviterrae]